MPNLIFDKVQAVPLVIEESGVIVGAAKGDRVEVEIERLDGSGVIELEVEENIDGGRVVEGARFGGGLEGQRWGWRRGWPQGGGGLSGFHQRREIRGEEMGFILG